MKQKNIKQLIKRNIKQLLMGGLVGWFLVFSFYVVDAAHFSGDKIQNQKNNDWFSSVYRCQADKLVPMTSKTKGQAVVELQNCLRFLNEEDVHMDGRWDSEVRKSVKRFYKHFLGKKSDGKKFDEAAITRMQELAAIAEPFIEVPPEAVSEIPPEDVVSEPANLKPEVERILAAAPAWQKEIETKAAAYGVKLSEKEIQKKQQLEGIEITFHDIVKWGARVRKEVKNNDYEEAYRFARLVEEAYLQAPQFFQELDAKVAIKQQQEAQEKEIAEAEKRYEAEQQALRDNFAAQEAAIARLGQETLERIFQEFKFTLPAGYIPFRELHNPEARGFVVQLIPENTNFWTDDENKIHYYRSPSIMVELGRLMEGYTFEVFEKEMTGGETTFQKGGGDDGGSSRAIAKKITLSGIPWYRTTEEFKASGKDKDMEVFSVTVSTVRNGFLYSIALSTSSDTPDAGTLKKVREDFERVVKSVEVQR